MKKVSILFIIFVIVFQSFTFADKKVDKKDDKFDIVDYDRSFFSNDIKFSFEGEISEDVNYELKLNDSEKFNLIIGLSSQEAPKYKNVGVKYFIGDIVSYNNVFYKCIQSHTTYGDPNWAPGIAHSLWAKIESKPNKDKPEKEKHYQIKVYNAEGKLVKVSNIKKTGEFSEADLNFDLGDYIDVSMGYNIEIENKKNGAKVVISAAPSIGMIALTFYMVMAAFLILKVRRG